MTQKIQKRGVIISQDKKFCNENEEDCLFDSTKGKFVESNRQNERNIQKT